MKVVLLPLIALLSLTGCHAVRDKDTPAVAKKAASSPTAATNEKADEKARDEMMSKSMDVQDQHWDSTGGTPATASSSIGAQAQPATAPTTNAGH